MSRKLFMKKANILHDDIVKEGESRALLAKKIYELLRFAIATEIICLAKSPGLACRQVGFFFVACTPFCHEISIKWWCYGKTLLWAEIVSTATVENLLKKLLLWKQAQINKKIRVSVCLGSKADNTKHHLPLYSSGQSEKLPH